VSHKTCFNQVWPVDTNSVKHMISAKTFWLSSDFVTFTHSEVRLVVKFSNM